MEQKKTEKGTPPPRYNEAFRSNAVRLVIEQGRQLTEVAKELGICIDTLCSWLKTSRIQMGQASRQNWEQQRIRELEAENRALRKQLCYPFGWTICLYRIYRRNHKREISGVYRKYAASSIP